MADDKEKLDLEIEVTYDPTGEKRAVDGMKNVDKAVKDLGKSSDETSKKLTKVITGNMDPATRKQVEGVLASMDKLDAAVKQVNKDVDRMMNAPKGTTPGELSGLEGDAKKVTRNVKEAVQETEKLADANKKAADQGERLAGALDKKTKRSMDRSLAPIIEQERREQELFRKLKNNEVLADDILNKVTNTPAVDKMVEKSTKVAKKTEDVAAAASSVVTVTKTLETAADKLVRVLDEEAEALERVASYADLSQKDMKALEGIQKSFARTARAAAKEFADEQARTNQELAEAVRLLDSMKSKQDMYAASQRRTTGIATGGPLNIPDYTYVQRIKNVEVSPEEYQAKLEDIKSNLGLLNQEIQQYMKLQETVLGSTQADIAKAMAMEDSKEKVAALNDALAQNSRMMADNSAVIKQTHLLSKDYMIGLIERTHVTEEDGEAEARLKQEVRDLANAYYSITAALDAVNNQARQRNADVKEEIVGTNKVLAGIKAQEQAEKKLAKQRKDAWSAAEKATNSMVSMMNTISQLTRRFGQNLTRYITVPLAGIAIKAAKFAADMEANLKTIQILLYNNAEAAEALYTQVVAYSAATPYEIPDLTEATKQLLSYGTASQDVMGELRMLGDLAQNDAKKLDSITQAFGKSQARGAIHMRELNRFILSGIPIMQALADVTDTSMSDIVESVRKGEISFKSVKAAMVALTSEGGRFHNMSKELAYTIKGRWATMSDEINLALKAFIDDFMPTIMKGINLVIEFAQALQKMSVSEKQVILDTLKMAAAVGPVLLGVSALTALLAGLAKVVLGLAKAINVLTTAGGISALVAGAGAPVLTIAAAAIVVVGALAAAAVGITRKVKDAKDLLEESMAVERAKEEFTPAAERAFSTLYGQKERGEPFSRAAIEDILTRYPFVDEESIRHIIDITEPLTAPHALETLNTNIEKSQKDMIKALEGIASKGYGGIYEEKARELLDKNAGELEILQKTVELIKKYQVTKTGVWLERGKSIFPGPGEGVRLGKGGGEELDALVELYENALQTLQKAQTLSKEYTTALDILQQRYLGSVVSPGAVSGVEVYGSFAGHLAETSETASERIRRLTAASSQGLSDALAENIRKLLKNAPGLDAATLKNILQGMGIEEGSVMHDVIAYIFDKKGTTADFDEVLLFFRESFKGIDTEVEGFLNEQEEKYKTDNILDYIFPDRGDTIEAGQKFAETMAESYKTVAASIIQGYLADNTPFDEAVKMFKENHEEYYNELMRWLGLSESKKIFLQITSEVQGAADTLKGIDWNPVQKFENTLFTLLDSVEGLDASSEEYTNFFNAIKQGAQNMAEAAYLTEKANLQDVIDQLDMSELDYFKKTLTKQGIDPSKFDELWGLKGLGETKTRAKEAGGALTDLDNEIKSVTMSTIDYQKHLWTNVHEYAAEDVDKLVKKYMELESVQKQLEAKELIVSEKESWEDRVLAIDLINKGYNEQERVLKMLERELAKIDDESLKKLAQEAYDYIKSNQGMVVYEELLQVTRDQLYQVRLTDEAYRYQTLSLQGLTSAQIEHIMAVERQVDAYGKMRAALQKLEEYGRASILTPQQRAETAAMRYSEFMSQDAMRSIARKHGMLGVSLDDYGETQYHVGTGNIDLLSRPVVPFGDDVATLRQISIEKDGRYINIPTIVNGKLVSDTEAIEHYHRTGEHLGVFDSLEAAGNIAQLTSNMMGDVVFARDATRGARDLMAKYPKGAKAKKPRGLAAMGERDKHIEAINEMLWDSVATALESGEKDHTFDVSGAITEAVDTASKQLALLDDAFPEMTNMQLFVDSLKDIGDELIALGLTGVVGMFEDWGKAMATGTAGADTFAQSLSNMLSSLVDALPQLLLNAGLSLIAAGNWPVGLALVAASAGAALLKGLKDGSENKQITGTGTGITLTKSAKGNLFSRGELLNSPTLFRTPSGFNLGGEQGTEAIMPLGRTADGKLGIYAMGQGGGQPNVVVNVINQSDNSEPEVVERTDTRGNKTIDVIIKNVVNKQISEGGYDRSLGARYGVRNRGIA